MTAAHLDPSRRHDVVLLLDVADGNPNGDPDAGNQPRTREFQIADGVQNLVANEFVGKPLQHSVRNVIAVYHQCVEKIGAACEARGAQFFRLLQKAEGARGRDIVPKSGL